MIFSFTCFLNILSKEIHSEAGGRIIFIFAVFQCCCVANSRLSRYREREAYFYNFWPLHFAFALYRSHSIASLRHKSQYSQSSIYLWNRPCSDDFHSNFSSSVIFKVCLPTLLGSSVSWQLLVVSCQSLRSMCLCIRSVSERDTNLKACNAMWSDWLWYDFDHLVLLFELDLYVFYFVIVVNTLLHTTALNYLCITKLPQFRC